MKKFFTTFFITLGVLFSIVLLIIAYLFIFDPLGIKPLFFGGDSKFVIPVNTTDTTNGTTTNNAGTSKPFLSESQKATLAKYGIDPASLPSSITVEQETCFKTKLGATRFAQIVAGDSPTAMEFLSAKSCI